MGQWFLTEYFSLRLVCMSPGKYLLILISDTWSIVALVKRMIKNRIN
jgi:hypothetical protein